MGSGEVLEQDRGKQALPAESEGEKARNQVPLGKLVLAGNWLTVAELVLEGLVPVQSALINLVQAVLVVQAVWEPPAVNLRALVPVKTKQVPVPLGDLDPLEKGLVLTSCPLQTSRTACPKWRTRTRACGFLFVT